MLESLHISNYALIDNVDISFHPGLNIITGETGAGKSIMLGALSLILGGRADMRAIKQSERKSIIEGIFLVSGNNRLREFCLESDIEWDDSRCILRREISHNGRSRAFVNDSPVSLSQLQSVALQLVDIHSQHQNQLLAQPDFQRRVLDVLADNEHKLMLYGQRYSTLKDAVKTLKQAKIRISKNKENEEFLQFQLEKLDELNPVPGEQEELEKDRDIAANLAELKGKMNKALNALGNGDHNILSQLDTLGSAIDDMASVIDENDNIPQRIESARIELNDILSTLQHIDDSLNGDPYELESIENRLEAIYDLERKHNVDTVEELVKIREDISKQLGELSYGNEILAELEKKARKAMALAKETAAEISAARKEAAKKFTDELTRKAVPLGMPNLTINISVTPSEMNSYGTDKVEFLFAFNKNQKPINVSGTASGGEISRLMLAIKAIIADKMLLPSIIFDEVDTGVSGDVANKMGIMMRDVSRNLQVIAITHLPQVAAKGNWHYKVKKEDDENATHTHIYQLTDEERVSELALMLSGDANNAAAKAAATELLNNNRTL